jgi:hypothetical protein
MHIERKGWEDAAITASNLSDLELMRGETAAAVIAGEQAVTFADRTGDVFQQLTKRTRQADALHQVGGRDESRRLFEDAELRQAAWQPQHPRLSSLQGFQYCDLLLADAERTAWQHWLGEEVGSNDTTIACDAVTERAVDALGEAKSNRWLLDIALNHLTLARGTLYKGEPARDHISAAVEGLRAAGDMSHLPRGLLTRAWARCLSGDEPGSRADLDEAWEIAERGPMPLIQADIQLTRARLFRDRVALEEARRLIEKHGYHRRDGELADAMAAAKGWGP